MAWTNPRTWTDGELVTASIMNSHVRDNLDAGGPHLIVRKTADETVSASVTAQNDNDLLFAVAASEIWQFEFNLLVTGAPAGDIAIDFTFPTGGTFSAMGIGGASTVISFAQFGATTSPTSTQNFGVTSTSLPDILRITGVFVNSTTAGNVQLQWAQQVASGSTVVKANSTLWAVKLA